MEDLTTGYNIHNVNPFDIQLVVRNYDTTRGSTYSTLCLKFPTDPSGIPGLEITLFTKEGYMSRDWADLGYQIRDAIGSLE